MEDAQMKIRLSRTLKGQIANAARANGRTMNGEIASRLERTFTEDVERAAGGPARLDSLEARVKALEKAMRRPDGRAASKPGRTGRSHAKIA